MITFTPSVVLAGFESAGKTALFRRLTGEATGHEANFRGSTVSCRSCHSEACQCEIIDTPGMRLKADTETTRLALEKVRGGDVVLLVVRGTNLQQEIEGLLHEINDSTKRLAVAVTFADKDEKKISTLACHYRETLGVPVVALNARDLSPINRTALLAAIQDACLPITTSPAAPKSSWKLVPSASWFEHHGVGPVLSLLVLALLWIIPVIAAFRLAAWLQPIIDDAFIGPVTDWLNARLSPVATALLTGGGVDAGADAGFFAGSKQSFCGGDLGIGDGDDADLLGGDPEREITGEVLDEQAHEALDGAEDGAVNHDGAVGAIVGADVFQLEALGQAEIYLDGS